MFLAQNIDGINHLLSEMQSTTEVMWMYFATKDGEMHIHPHTELDDGFDPRNRQWYKDAVKKDGLIYSEPYIDTASKKPCITIALPVKDSQGNLLGVLGAAWQKEQPMPPKR